MRIGGAPALPPPGVVGIRSCPRCGEPTGDFRRAGLDLVCRPCTEGGGFLDPTPRVVALFPSHCSPADGRYCPTGLPLKLAADRAYHHYLDRSAPRFEMRHARRELDQHVTHPGRGQ